MRVAIDYTAAVNQSAGIGRFVRSLVCALAEIDQETSYLLLHARPERPEGTEQRFPEGPNFRRRQIPLRQRYLDILWQRLRLPLPISLFSGAVDVFHSPDFVLPPVGLARSLLTVHDLAFLIRPECADARLRAYLEQAVPRSVRRADFVVADSESTRADVIRLLGASPERVGVVPGGVDPSFAPVQDEAALKAVRAHIGVAEAPFILAVGVIEPRKNLRLLLDAYALLRSRHAIPHHLVLVGRRGWLWEETVAHAERSPYREQIHFAGHVPDGSLAALYSAADVLAFPSFYEGFGLPPLEAMACGTPVVTSRASSLPEVVGDAGLMVDPDEPEELVDALDRVLSDDALRACCRARGLQRAAELSWPVAAARLLEVYRMLASE